MAKYLHVEGLEPMLDWLKRLDGSRMAELHDRILRTAGMRFLEYAQDLTPRRTSRLAGSLSVGNTENVFILRVGRKISEVLAGTTVDYAEYVNDGFTQKRGQFVPGEWKSGTFHYMPKSENPPGGMVLTGKTIEGARMFDKAMDQVEKELPKIILAEVKRLFSELSK